MYGLQHYQQYSSYVFAAMSIVGENWSSLNKQLFIFDLLHAHRSLPIGGFVPYTTETRFVFQYPMLPRFMSVKIVNDFTSYTFVNSRQFCCTNMNYSNLLQTSCIDIEIMIYVLSSVLLNPPRFPHENYVRFVPHLFVGELMSYIFYLYLLRIVAFNMYLLDE